jgi:dienelactone hydrolase
MRTTRFLFIAICLWLLGGCGQQVEPPPVEPPQVDLSITSPLELDYDSDRFFAANRHLFDYDAAEPLEIEETGGGRTTGVTATDLTYRSPRGGRVPATLLVPDGPGRYAGIVMMHGMPSNRQAMLAAGTAVARAGAVVILIDAPFARPENQGRDALTLTGQDREEQIQLIVDLRRAIDLLLTRPEVDPDRLAYYGVSYGGAMGGLLAGVEDRLQAYVLVVGDGGLVTHLTGPEDWPRGELARLPEAGQQAWLEAMWPIEPIHYVAHAAPAALLFQNGTADRMVPAADALRYQAAGSEPKTVLWYEAAHRLGPEAFEESVAWLGDQVAPGDLLLLDTSFRSGVVLIGRLLLVWLVLTLGALLYLLWDLARRRQATWAVGLAWLLTCLFFGPLALLAYLFLYLRRLPSPEPGSALSDLQRALGASMWGAARNMVGGVLAVGLILALPDEIAAQTHLWLPAVVLLPLATGLIVYAALQWAARGGVTCWLRSRRTLATELVTAVSFLLAAYPLVIWLGERWIAGWWPFGAGLSNPATWILLILAAWAGAVTTYPVQLWMLGRGFIQWGPEVRKDEKAAPQTDPSTA